MARVLLVDLNNFAHYPSIAVGLLTAALRRDGHEVRVFSPLAHGVRSRPRERTETLLDHLERRISFSCREWLTAPRAVLGRARSRWHQSRERRAAPAFARALRTEPDVVMISTYTDSRPLVQAMCEAADDARIPVVIGGPIFSQSDVAESWRHLPAVRAVVGAEFERRVSALCEEIVDSGAVSEAPGLHLPGSTRFTEAPSERDLDDLPIPDYSDFPWDEYDTRVLPVQMSRGCGWNRCTFCGDIVTANGRGFRSRSVRRVLDEMRLQARRHDCENFVFLDLKLNSQPRLWRQLIEGIGAELPRARWIASVHVQRDVDCGLEPDDLRAARQSGLARVTFGLESGSQRVLDSMDKGTCVRRSARFVRQAAEAGISVRTTIIQGYPGETAAELRETSALLDELSGSLERVRVNRLNVLEGTAIAEELAGSDGESSIGDLRWEHEWARCRFTDRRERDRDYRSAIRSLLRSVHRINRKPLSEAARDFHGLM